MPGDDGRFLRAGPLTKISAFLSAISQAIVRLLERRSGGGAVGAPHHGEGGAEGAVARQRVAPGEPRLIRQTADDRLALLRRQRLQPGALLSRPRFLGSQALEPVDSGVVAQPVRSVLQRAGPHAVRAASPTG